MDMTLDELRDLLSEPAWPEGITAMDVLQDRIAHADKWRLVIDAPYDEPVVLVGGGTFKSVLRPATLQNLCQLIWCAYVGQERIQVRRFYRPVDARSALQRSA